MIIRSELGADQLLNATAVEGQVANQAFLPIDSASDARHFGELSLVIKETLMNCNHQGVRINRREVDLFPAVIIRLAIDDGNLLPIDRGILRSPAGNSYWDLSLSPGIVWSEPGDGSWSRAALPFQLFNILENDSHHGIASFLYNDGAVSSVFYQIVAETKTFLCPENFQAWGWLEPDIVSTDFDDAAIALDRYFFELQDALPIKALDELTSDLTRSHINALDHGFASDSTLVSGLVIDNRIYATPCKTSMGSYPYPRAMKFGVWSVTKSAFCSVALLRLAQLTGEDPRNAMVVDLLDAAGENPDWLQVTIGDCLNMASAIGTANQQAEPSSVFSDYLIEPEHGQMSKETMASYQHYHRWFQAPGQQEKNIACFACPGYPWPPSSVCRYRDQDLYIAGAAMDALLKRKFGASARIWDMVNDEVYAPAKIHHAIKFHTIEDDPDKSIPLSDAGLLMSLDNVARLGNLIHQQGIIDGEQILQANMFDELFNPAIKQGLATGLSTDDGEIHYFGGIWRLPYRSSSGKLWWLPTMRGYGGQIIQPLPNGITSFRFGFDSYKTEQRYDALKLARLADAFRPF